MKKRILKSIMLLVVIVVAFMAGLWVEDAKRGYHYKVLEESEVKSELGPINWKSVIEYVGLPFLEPETTVIEVDGRIIYKARRGFQERYPVAQNVRVNDGLIEWDDREYSFSLKMQKMPGGGPDMRATTAPNDQTTTRRVGETQPAP